MTVMTKDNRQSLRIEISELKKERILGVAAELFTRDGFHNVSMDQVARQLGATKPFVYTYYKDKKALLFAICRRGALLTLKSIEDVENMPLSARDKIRVICNSLASTIIDNQNFIAVYNRESISLRDEQSRQITNIRDDIDQRLSALLHDANKQDEVDVIDPQITSSAITVMLSSLWFSYKEKGQEHREEFLEKLTQLAMRTITARAS